ncbi:MAG: oligoendopeptidase F [Lachnospiraceae bacterium]|nr:oligoendopeptidase F [Lachnospiraceae bacterium]
MAENRVPERSEIEEKYKWNITTLFGSDEEWEKALNSLDEPVAKCAAYRGRLSGSPKVLQAFLDDTQQLERKMEDLFTYAFLRYSEDTRAEAGQVMRAKAMGKLMPIGALLSFAEPELLAMEEAKFGAYLEAEELADYRHMLEDLNRRRPHTLSAAEEKILTGMHEVTSAPGTIADALMDADLIFDPIKKEDGEEMELTGSNYILHMMDPDRRVREQAFRNFYKSYKQHVNTFAATYSGSVRGDVFEARTRNYPSARAMSMAADNIPESVYLSLVEAVHRHLPAMYRYVALRKKILGLDELHYYDVYAPLCGDLDLRYSYEEAQEMVKKAVAPLGEDYVNTVARGFEERWIDVYPNAGKSGGAYSSGTYDSSPFIMCNFTGTLDSVSTIAHEMGHSIHTYLANTHQPHQYARYTLFVAEIASTVNENLLIEQLLQKETDPKVRLYLLNQYLENFKGTIFRQVMFAEFENKAHELIEQGEALSAAKMNSIYADLVKLYFGPELAEDEEYSYEWARIPHFYRMFYVYKYATGYSSAVALSEKILKEGEPAVKKYLEFLSMGGSDYPLETLKHAGIDLSTPEPIDRALEKFERIVAEAEEICGQLS